MAVTNEQIVNYLQTPGLTDTQIAQAMRDNGVTTQQVADAIGAKEADIASRYNTATAIDTWQKTAKPTADTAWAAQMDKQGWDAQDVSRATGVDAGSVTNRYQTASGLNKANADLAALREEARKDREQLVALQKTYADLQAKTPVADTAKSGILAPSAGTPSAPTVDTSLIGTANKGTTVEAGTPSAPTTQNTATTGVVYGPDGQMYSSAAAAIAAGVRNFSPIKPVGLVAGADRMGSQFITAPATASGSSNPGGFISSANQQLFKNVVSAQMPYGVKNPFSQG